jgi:hypothetical protein
MRSNAPNNSKPVEANEAVSREIPRKRKIRLWLRKLFRVEQFDWELK